ncbi:MAG: aminotransferase class I/II-fold pyridoxal phosphate-dependent enzyme [Chloroflexi bacterium]|nr:aminotransferase class I/II-fold pyridoxal phosphate-dependent enzyme [Chloroflexota bacterium]
MEIREMAVTRAPGAQHPSPNPWVAALTPAVHGALDRSVAEENGVSPDHVLDFSANGNVIGPPEAVGPAIAGVDVTRYPDRRAAMLARALEERHGVTPSAVVVGNGSTEMIWSVARAYLAPGDVALVVGPTYGEYAAASAAMGAEVCDSAVMNDVGGATPHVAAREDEVAASVRRRLEHVRPRVAWICHPNNPTGAPFPVWALPEFAAASPGTLFVVDEAYLPLCDALASALPAVAGGRVVMLRSLTKDLALAGLRVGYAVAAPGVADALRRVTPPWSVSSVAQAAALAALADDEHARRARAAVTAARAHLSDGLQRLGLHPRPSVANFVLVRVGDGPAVARRLLELGCAVRDCTSFGLPECIRIGVRAIHEQERLLAALASVLRNEG